MKRILKWPRHFSNTAALTALEVPTMRCSHGLSVQIRESFFNEISSLSLIKECEELGEHDD